MKEKVTIFGAVGAAVIASICCIGPVVLAGLGIGAVAAAQAFAPYRPYFLTLTFALLGLGFYFAYRKPKQGACEGEVCERPPVARLGRPLLWLTTVIVIGLAMFPLYYAPVRVALDGEPAAISTAFRPASVVSAELRIEGMTCEGCAAAIRSKLLESPGVVAAEVDYPAGRAHLQYDPAKTDPARLIEVANASGYRAALVEGGNPAREDRP